MPAMDLWWSWWLGQTLQPRSSCVTRDRHIRGAQWSWQIMIVILGRGVPVNKSRLLDPTLWHLTTYSTCTHTYTHKDACVSKVPNPGSLIFAHYNPPLFSHCCHQIYQLGPPIHYHNAISVCVCVWFCDCVWLCAVSWMRFCCVSVCIYCMFTRAGAVLYIGVCDIYLCVFSFACCYSGHAYSKWI